MDHSAMYNTRHQHGFGGGDKFIATNINVFDTFNDCQVPELGRHSGACRFEGACHILPFPPFHCCTKHTKNTYLRRPGFL